MRFARAFGGEYVAALDEDELDALEDEDPTSSTPPGQFFNPLGVTVVRGLVVVSEEKRLQVLTLKGVPLQVLTLGTSLRGLCADEKRVWVADRGADQVHALALA